MLVKLLKTKLTFILDHCKSCGMAAWVIEDCDVVEFKVKAAIILGESKF